MKDLNRLVWLTVATVVFISVYVIALLQTNDATTIIRISSLLITNEHSSKATTRQRSERQYSISFQRRSHTLHYYKTSIMNLRI